MGSNHQSLEFVVDTGSPWTWVIDTRCPSRSCGSRTKKFDFQASKTYFRTPMKKDLLYAKGVGQGRVARDTFYLDHVSKIKVEKFNFVSVFLIGNFGNK